jgi:hypothetical protein
MTTNRSRDDNERSRDDNEPLARRQRTARVTTTNRSGDDNEPLARRQRTARVTTTNRSRDDNERSVEVINVVDDVGISPIMVNIFTK